MDISAIEWPNSWAGAGLEMVAVICHEAGYDDPPDRLQGGVLMAYDGAFAMALLEHDLWKKRQLSR